MTAPAPHSETEVLRLKAEGVIEMLGVRSRPGGQALLRRRASPPPAGKL
jgi:hypothetical protein